MSINVSSIGVSEGVQQFVVEVVVDPPSLVTLGVATQKVILDGVGIGDHIQVVMPYDGQSIVVTAAPDGEGSADINFQSSNLGTVDLAPGLFKFIITRA